MPDTAVSPAVEPGFRVDAEKFRIVTGAAHRKPPPLVGAPALILHYGLWRPDQGSEDDWHDAIDWFLYFMYRVLQMDPGFSPVRDLSADPTNPPHSHTISPNYDFKNSRLYLFKHVANSVSAERVEPPAPNAGIPLDVELVRHFRTDVAQSGKEGEKWEVLAPNDRSAQHDVFSVRTPFRGLHLIVRVELFSEFWSLDFICDFDQFPPDAGGGRDPRIDDFAKDFDDLYGLIKNCYRGARPSERDTARLVEIRKTLHKRFRDLVTKEIVDPCLKAVGRQSAALSQPDARLTMSGDDARAAGHCLGTPIAEFHGAVFGLVPSGDELSVLGLGNNYSKPRRSKSIEEQVGRNLFTDEIALKVVNAIWPVIEEIQHTTEDDALSEKRHGRPEFTACVFQDRRSLYVSSLGWLEPRRESVKPIIYTVIVGYHSRWSLGRLIERIHGMGSLRLAAMRDIEKITRAGDALKVLEDELTHDERTSRGRIIDGGRYAERLFEIGSDIKYGLMHRVERSGYYVAEFERHCKHLRLHRIEGFQPYDQFVDRRMYGAYDYIRRVGGRYRELRQEVELILRKNNAAQIQGVVADIKKSAKAAQEATETSAQLQKESAQLEKRSAELQEASRDLLNQIRALDAETGRVENRIRRLQENGELLLFLFLVPYYFAYTIQDVGHEVGPALLDFLRKRSPGLEWLEWFLLWFHRYEWFLVWTGFSAYALGKFISTRIKERAESRRLRSSAPAGGNEASK